jgi:hypothetical protein
MSAFSNALSFGRFVIFFTSKAMLPDLKQLRYAAEKWRRDRPPWRATVQGSPRMTTVEADRSLGELRGSRIVRTTVSGALEPSAMSA